ncbi:hypothetical protein ACVIGB_004695 [Bradyrhizobium sp. USDA 4341]
MACLIVRSSAAGQASLLAGRPLERDRCGQNEPHWHPAPRLPAAIDTAGMTGVRDGGESASPSTVITINSEFAAMTRRITIARSGLIACCLIGLSASAVVMAVVLRSSGAASPHQAALVPVEYVPSISDLMIGTIQPRHERLWRAAQDSNWDFAAYELGNLHGAFARLGRAHPTEQNMSFPDMIAGVTDQPFKDLNGAIQAKDQAAFSKAYGELTDACNSCHQALNHGVVVIGRPDAESRSDLILRK